MFHKLSKALLVVALSATVGGLSLTQTKAEEKVLTITSAVTMVTHNPYAHSEVQSYTIWCEVYGCLGRIDYITKELKPVLVEKWEVIDPTTMRFTLRRDLVRHDGGPGPTSKDVVHSWNRIMTDPDSSQRWMMYNVSEMVAVDEHTFDIKTVKPAGQLLWDIFSLFAVTSADLHEEHGNEAYKSHPFGWGPYQLEEYAIDERIVIRKSERWPEDLADAPDVVVFTQMRDAEQRVTAILNNEVQVARLIPPQLVDRLKDNPEIKIVPTESVEPMFVGFNNNFEPWDNVLIRRAAAYAINRDAIVENILFGYASPLDGAIGPQQTCYEGPSAIAPKYDLQKAKELLAEAGFADGGPEIDYYVSTGRYISDRQIGEAIAQMLTEAGFKVTLHTPEWANMWADVRAGKTPAYYMGRNQTMDPAQALSQYFETGVSPRLNYSDPDADALFAKIPSIFDEEERCQAIRELVDKLATDVPAHFLWSHQLITGVRANVTWPADPSGEPWLPDVSME